jgi:4-hydroxy-3-methylbut-2-enyl diphosphate reductase
MKSFNVPITYRSSLITNIKNRRKQDDKLKKDFSPTELDFGAVKILLARHFGFCYGVENAIEISFRAVDENLGKRVYLLSEMIHNPQVNNDLLNKGVTFLQDTSGKEIIPIESLSANDIVIIPAFGTTLEIENRLAKAGIEPHRYNSTCPFVERVWNKAEQIGEKGYSIIIHGKPNHEETRATFSHSKFHTPSVVVKDMKQTIELAKYITGEKNADDFYTEFKGQFSDGFDITKDIQKIGVVNQTTMLASDTQAISDFLKNVMIKHFNLTADNLAERFADTRDTLCYATNDNQTAVRGMLEYDADLAIVVGGYNSSNTSHLVELCEEQLPTYYISNADEIISTDEIHHFNFHEKKKEITFDFIPQKKQITIMLTSGASCPDAVVESVIEKITTLVQGCKTLEEVF